MVEDDEIEWKLFDEALKLRDAGQLESARTLLLQFIEQLGPDDKLMLGHAHLQLGFIAALLRQNRRRESHFRAAATTLPDNELASVALFGALFTLGREDEAFEEMVRLLQRDYSKMYDDMLSYPGLTRS